MGKFLYDPGGVVLTSDFGTLRKCIGEAVMNEMLQTGQAYTAQPKVFLVKLFTHVNTSFYMEAIRLTR